MVKKSINIFHFFFKYLSLSRYVKHKNNIIISRLWSHNKLSIIRSEALERFLLELKIEKSFVPFVFPKLRKWKIIFVVYQLTRWKMIGEMRGLLYFKVVSDDADFLCAWWVQFSETMEKFRLIKMDYT